MALGPSERAPWRRCSYFMCSEELSETQAVAPTATSVLPPRDRAAPRPSGVKVFAVSNLAAVPEMGPVGDLEGLGTS